MFSISFCSVSASFMLLKSKAIAIGNHVFIIPKAHRHLITEYFLLFQLIDFYCEREDFYQDAANIFDLACN